MTDQLCEEMAIKLLQEKGYKIEKPEPEKIELKGGGYQISGRCGVEAYTNSKDYNKNGASFKSYEIAEAVAKQRLKRNRLEAYAVEYMGGVYEWKYGEENYYVFFNHTTKRYEYELVTIWQCFDPHMTKDCAEYLCEALNSGRIVL